MYKKERDYYEILGVPKDADQKTIKDAYHRLAMKWHPDRSKSPDAEQHFKEIAKAYAILSDPKKRAQYDAGGFEGIAHYSHDDLFRNIDLGSIFGDIGFGFGPGGDSIFERFFQQPRKAKTRGEDIHINLEIPLELVAKGGSESLQFTHPATCSRCGGYGTKNGKPPPPCKACAGSGHKVLRSQQQRDGGHSFQFQQLTTCPTCHGYGIQIEEPCPECSGSGKIQQPKKLKLEIPAGIEDGMTLRIPNHGHPGTTPRSQAGHLYVTIHTSPDHRFQRRGIDLWRSETVQLDEAVLGTKLLVPTLDGNVEVTIPPGVQPDEILRLRGKGLPRYQSNQHGDLNLRIQIHVPTELSKEEKQHYEALQALREKRH